ncbi:mll2065 [Mesorhizobium japonicum MAFF 303099]|uniref:Mll2065 protein n=1 Tax=Mesorhizobium japonicum (strain LMG 29417 / CECT 9101 / MAFF 303099) TaxID=266835 RepID=Q98J78_RHILO|nr:mll2065 [Mesorhizobium japonicum MAFF 303099]
MSVPSLTANAPLIVIDLQTGMFDGLHEPPIHDAPAIAERARAVIDWARRGGRKVAFVRHDGPEGDPLAPGEAGWPVWSALGQAEDEPTFAKSVRDAFSNPAFGDWVVGQGGRWGCDPRRAERFLRRGNRQGRDRQGARRHRGFRCPQHAGQCRRERRADHRPT